MGGILGSLQPGWKKRQKSIERCPWAGPLALPTATTAGDAAGAAGRKQIPMPSVAPTPQCKALPPFPQICSVHTVTELLSG
jgi:hypothetical protein